MPVEWTSHLSCQAVPHRPQNSASEAAVGILQVSVMTMYRVAAQCLLYMASKHACLQVVICAGSMPLVTTVQSQLGSGHCTYCCCRISRARDSPEHGITCKSLQILQASTLLGPTLPLPGHSAGCLNSTVGHRLLMLWTTDEGDERHCTFSCCTALLLGFPNRPALADPTALR